MDFLVTLEQIMPFSWWAISILAFVILILLIAIVRVNGRLKRFEASHVALQTFMSGKKLDDLLEEFIKNLDSQTSKIKENEKRINKVEDKVRVSVDKAALLRFNAFENVGGELSFALALLNQAGDGVVLSSIHSREEARVYAKAIKNGESKHQLSKEEKEVINKGMDTLNI